MLLCPSISFAVLSQPFRICASDMKYLPSGAEGNSAWARFLAVNNCVRERKYITQPIVCIFLFFFLCFKIVSISKAGVGAGITFHTSGPCQKGVNRCKTFWEHLPHSLTIVLKFKYKSTHIKVFSCNTDFFYEKIIHGNIFFHYDFLKTGHVLSKESPLTLGSCALWAYVLKLTSTFTWYHSDLNLTEDSLKRGKTLSSQIDEWGNRVFYTWIKLAPRVVASQDHPPLIHIPHPGVLNKTCEWAKKKRRRLFTKEFNF